MSRTMFIAVMGCMFGAAGVAPARAQSSWIEKGQITPSSTNTVSQQHFGTSLASFDDWLLAGSYEVDATGSAYLFELQGSQWVETYEFYPDMLLPDDEFGSAVAITAGVAVVGAPRSFGSGAVHVYEGAVGAWTEVECFSLQPLVPDARFGAAVVASGDIALVGAPGLSRVYVLERVAGIWLWVGELVPTGPAPSEFGATLALDGTRAVVGAPGSGTAHVFERVFGVWTELAVLLPDDPGLERFGASVALHLGEILVGAPDEDGQGAAVLFALGSSGWIQTAEWQDVTPSSSGEYGFAVALGTDLAVVGSPWDEDNGILGSAHVYERSGSTWTETAELFPDFGSEEKGTFGSSLALVDPFVLVNVGLNDSGVLGYVGSVSFWGKGTTPVPYGSGPKTTPTGDPIW